MNSTITTRFLIMSDTHGVRYHPTDLPDQLVDVAIHCGDLTDGSRLDELRDAVHRLRNVKATLKLVIAGNHDFTLDDRVFRRKVKEATSVPDPSQVAREYGFPGQPRRLLREARKDGIMFLDEGTHTFALENGARLTVYASPYTPATCQCCGFQYRPDKGHDFAIGEGTDIVITHGPPRGMLDYTRGKERAGCPDLFQAIATSKPRLHCFGHIHEGWGAKLVAWRNDISCDVALNTFTAIDKERSVLIERLAGLQAAKLDWRDNMARRELEAKLQRYKSYKCCKTTHRAGDEHPIVPGQQTLFVNASMLGSDGQLSQRPWVVDIDMPKAV